MELGTVVAAGNYFSKPVVKMWRKFVKYLMVKNPHTPLKELLSNYSKKEYEEFKRNPRKFV